MLSTLQERVANRLSALIDAITQGLPGAPAPPPPGRRGPLDPEQLRAVCTDLAGHLAACDFAAGHLLARHEDLLRAGLGTDFEPLAEDIGDYHFSAALERLQQAALAHGISL